MKLDIIAKILIILFAIFYLSLLDSSPNFVLSDTNTYILLGKSLSSGQGYRQIWEVGNPKYKLVPPLFPLLLAPLIYFFGYNFLMMKLLIVIMTIGSLWLVYSLFKRLTDESMALLILILTGFSTQLVYFSQEILTEVPYLFFSLLALIFVEKNKNQNSFPNKSLLFSIFFVYLSYLTRYIGISLLAAVPMYFLFEKKLDKNFWPNLKTVFLIWLFMLIPIVLWALRCYDTIGIQGTYLQEFFKAKNPLNLDVNLGFLERIMHCTYAYIFYAYPKVLIAIQFPHRNPIAFMLTAVTFYGFLYCLFKRRTILEYYIIFYMLILFCWSWSISSGARFLVPIIPFIFYYFLIGSKRILEAIRTKGRFRKWILIFLAMILLLSNIKESVLFSMDKSYLRGDSQKRGEDLLALAQWAKNNTTKNSIFGTLITTFVYLFFERKAVGVPCTRQDNKLIAAIYKNKVNYIVIDSLFPRSEEYLKPIIIRHPDKFIEVYRRNNSAIYKVKNP